MSDVGVPDAPTGIADELFVWEEQFLGFLTGSEQSWSHREGQPLSQRSLHEAAGRFSPHLATGATATDVNRLSAALRSFCKRGITLFGTSPTGDAAAQCMMVRAYQLCQSLAEVLVSSHYLNRLGCVRRERRWDQLHPSTVGCVHTVSDGRGNRAASTILIGQPCMTCDRGRLALVKGTGDLAVVICNAGCRMGSERLLEGLYGVPVEPAPCHRTTDERMIWSEPAVFEGRAQYLPYHELGLHVT